MAPLSARRIRVDSPDDDQALLYDVPVNKEFFNKTIRTGQEFVHKHKQDKSRTALAKKILELAIEQGRENMAVLKAG